MPQMVKSKSINGAFSALYDEVARIVGIPLLVPYVFAAGEQIKYDHIQFNIDHATELLARERTESIE